MSVVQKRAVYWVPAALASAILAVVAGFAQTPAPKSRLYSISPGIRLTLPRAWQSSGTIETPPPPAALAASAPLFHLSQVMVFDSGEEGAILQIATSNNPLLGHDSYWLDQQMHTAVGSGYSLPDLLFYFFVPPPPACMDKVMHSDADASRVPLSDESAASELQVYYACDRSPSLSDVYATQVSSGVRFRSGDTGTRATGAFGDFYLAPMQQVDSAGLTFYVFEAQQLSAIASRSTAGSDLPEKMLGATADFFWAVGAPSPFPFTPDASRDTAPLVHVFYAGAGLGENKRSEFLDLLHQFRASDSEDVVTENR